MSLPSPLRRVPRSGPRPPPARSTAEAVDRPTGHALPLTADTLRRVVTDPASHDVYLCGPPGMTAAAKEALRAAGVPRHRVHHESFAF
ncbi:hypothetical protein ACFYYR_14410 [Streptomyces sp. NPDC001922]|uniref:hypothetical protein n=1 Tax=Streptomyces sp. NPDC001922 TaxID=3364624 RepID=UPI0036A09241